MTCLVFLAQDGTVTAARIVAHSGMDKMLVSDLIKALQRKRLLVRARNPDDARSWLIEPTTRGIQLTNSAVARIEALDEKFFTPVRDLKGLKKDLLALATFALPAD
jgi:MarR family transcriptional regulator, organic hydroperoxide resistance regulator